MCVEYLKQKVLFSVTYEWYEKYNNNNLVTQKLQNIQASF